jgi:hypothetical protein
MRRPTGTRQPAPRSLRPTAEVLEARTLLSNLLLIDFTPDRLPHEGRLPPFAHGFQIRNAHGRPLRFLDFDIEGMGRSGSAWGRRDTAQPQLRRRPTRLSRMLSGTSCRCERRVR